MPHSHGGKESHWDARLPLAFLQPSPDIDGQRCHFLSPVVKTYIQGGSLTPSRFGDLPVSQPSRRCASLSFASRLGRRSSAMGSSHWTYSSGQSVASYPRPRSTWWTSTSRSRRTGLPVVGRSEE